eukprot:Nitzschia sp. Nitz4//scaffold332_size19022//11608//12048//NITZ4_008742-RA/size19022-processed-gene-0.31-mRNA-1//1//CDS//3329548207//7943//frame0
MSSNNSVSSGIRRSHGSNLSASMMHRVHSQDSRDHYSTASLADNDWRTLAPLSETTQRTDTSLLQLSSLTDFMIDAATTCNRLIVEKCGICTGIYGDQQLQYEVLAASGALDRPYQGNTAAPTREVQEAQCQLFDEESVVESVHTR